MSLAKKLFIKKGYRLTVVNAPDEFNLLPDELPEEVEVADQVEGQFDFVLLFAKNQDDLKTYIPKILGHIKESALFWIAYPKKSSKIKSDISRDAGWDVLHNAGYVGVSLISIDDTWSCMRFRQEEAVKKASK